MRSRRIGAAPCGCLVWGFPENANVGFGMILGRCDTHAWLKSGAELTVRDGSPWARRDFRPTVPWAPPPPGSWLLDSGSWILAPGSYLTSICHGTKRRRFDLIRVFR